MTTGASMQAMIRTAPPQAEQVSISMPKTRFRCGPLTGRWRLANLPVEGIYMPQHAMRGVSFLDLAQSPGFLTPFDAQGIVQ
jgi:hypothetical protein